LARRGKTMGDHDAIIIGTGQSGPSLARRLVAAGQKVAVIERNSSAALASIPDAHPPRRSLDADRIFINVGGRALAPSIPQVPYLTNSSMMDVDFLPQHLIVLGGSYIGLEFAQVYRRFGSEVTVIELAPRLIARGHG